MAGLVVRVGRKWCCEAYWGRSIALRRRWVVVKGQTQRMAPPGDVWEFDGVSRSCEP